MDLVSIPANPVPEGAVTGTLKTPRRRRAALCALAAAAGPQGHACACSRAAPSSSRNISRPCANCARAASRSRRSTGAGRGCSERALRDPRKGHVGDFSEYELDLDDLHEGGRAAGLPAADLRARRIRWARTVLMRAAHQGQRWFDRIVLSAPMIGLAGHAPLALSRSRGRARCG